VSDLFGWILKTTAAPKIIHSIPGRLRIKVPHLKHVPIERSLIEKIVHEALTQAEGFQSLEISFVTSTLLIRYDQELTSEKEIVSFLQGLTERAIDRRKELINSVKDGSVDGFIQELAEKQNGDTGSDK